MDSQPEDLDDPILALRDLELPTDPDFESRLTKTIQHREGAANVGHLQSAGLLRVVCHYLELVFQLFSTAPEPPDHHRSD
ncbi:MAG: hypothetical protein OEO23_10825 [Gemmatimonadota bacterium]|nr:hypothetical protein [Gemmatimonadota bacterium]